MINQTLLLAGDDAYNLSKSLRFRSSASAYLNRTPASAGNRKTWTYSAWVKLGAISANTLSIFGGGTVGSNWGAIEFDGSTGQIYVRDFNGSGNDYIITGTPNYRDYSAWYHLVVKMDNTQSTESFRLGIWINGVSVPVTGTYPAQNTDYRINNSVEHRLMRYMGNAANYLDGYLSEVNFIDGQALTPSSFGETDVLTGVWKPKKFVGTYGTNGFYLPFTDVATTSGSNAGLGKDFSGNGNYWTTNNISVTAGSTYDSMTDVPTLTSATTANYCVWNPLAVGSGITTSNGNLSASASNNSNAMLQGTFGITSGKWYWEVTLSSGTSAWAGSIIKSSAGLNYSSLSSGDAYSYSNDGSKYNGQSSTGYGSTYTTNDVISVAYNADTGKIWYAKNGTWQASGDPAAGTNEAFSGISGTYMPSALLNSATGIANFGAGSGFTYTPPTGFVALNTFNLPEPSIKAGNKHFDATTYSGNGTSQTITNASGFAPDFVWIKGRNYADNHTLWNTVVGAQKSLSSDTTTAETTRANALTAFASNGFTLGTDTIVNYSAGTYVGWQWKANGTGSSNTAGSITSTVSANPTAGFSVVTYTANGTTGTIGHGLGVAPSMIIVKKRNAVERWCVYHTSTSNAYLYLNETFAAETGNANIRFGNNSVVVQPTSSVFTIGSSNDVNGTSGTYVAYCWSEIAGFSKFGSYTGNGSADGSFVYLGFRPRYVLIKSTVEASNWLQYDTARMTYNKMDTLLYPSLSNAENTDSTYAIDILSNGFKIRGTGQYGGLNNNGNAYIYMAFAENPTKFALAR